MFRYVTDAEAEQIRVERAKAEQATGAGETANAKSDKKDSAAPQ